MAQGTSSIFAVDFKSIEQVVDKVDVERFLQGDHKYSRRDTVLLVLTKEIQSTLAGSRRHQLICLQTYHLQPSRKSALYKALVTISTSYANRLDRSEGTLMKR